MRSSIVAILSAVLLGSAGSAAASVVILGDGMGRECYLSAALKRSAATSLEICTNALQGALSQRDRAATFVNRGVVYAESGNPEAALQDYQQALRIDPSLGEAHVNSGIALMQIGGRDREAIEALTRAIVMGAPRIEVAYYTRAMAYELVGEVRAAYDDYHAAVDARPDWDAPREQLKRFSIVRRERARG